MTFEISGEYNTATVYTAQSKDEAEDEAIEQIQTIVDHEAFASGPDVDEGNISIMPDFHWGAGAVIGFTMPLRNRIVPNTIGVDIGCGMYAVNFGEVDVGDLETLDEAIRERIPTGFDVHDRNSYHVANDFPWNECQRKLDTFTEQTDFEVSAEYGPDYFSDLCQRIGYDQTRAINSVGTLGGGNHFIELGEDEDGSTWCIIHSGSRGIGAEIAQWWQDEATEKMFARRNLVEIPKEEVKYFNGEGLVNDGNEMYARPNDLEIDREAILEDYDGEAIEGKFGQLKQYMNAGKADADPLDYLEGDEAAGYIRDMVFAQTYASESRKQMMRRVNAALLDCDFSVRRNQWQAGIESVHNYIDFDDAVIRKGACRAHEGERLVVPFNMSYGTIIARGKGNESWNNSSAHGAGRAMSRTEAKNRFSESDYLDQASGVYMSKKPVDEIPGAYKSPEAVEEALGENVDVETRIEPFLSIKAE